jgi:hypothetical protein
MIKNGVPYCDYCNKELVALREEEALGDIEPHGWTDWRTASVHACFECYDNMWEPPCGECETHPCQKGRECWANPPLHLFPYETYFANKLGETYAWKMDAEAIEETEDESEEEKKKTVEDAAIRRRQLMRLAGQHPNQKVLLVGV